MLPRPVSVGGNQGENRPEIELPPETPVNWQDASVLITGGTGSFGQKLTEVLMRDHPPKRLIVFSRDELKQSEMRKRFPDAADTPIRYFVGDVRDRDRLQRAFNM
jgi:UDP-N-acetylglucosamine 4,6-dehydratase